MTTVLRPRFAKTFEDHRVWLVIMPPLFLLLLPAVVIALFLDPSKVAELYYELVLPTVVLLPATVGLMIMIARSQLELSESGVKFNSGLPGFLKQQADWEASWDDIESATLKAPPMSHPLTAALQIRAAGAGRRLVPWQWIEPGTATQKAKPGLLGFGRKRHFKTLVANTPLALAFQAAGKLPPHPSDEGDEHAIQNADAPSKIIATIFVVAVAYFIGDSYFGLEEYYVGTPPWQWLLVVGLFAAVVAWLALNAGTSSAVQAPFIALLFGGGMALAAYPGLLRMNAWSDTGGFVSYEYTLEANDTWTTPGEAPDLVFDVDSRYWDQFLPGNVKEFQLRSGGLGFTQVNMAPIYVEQQAFYADPNLSLASDQSQNP